MRYALVIGNSEYDDGTLAQLKTPITDTQALAAALNDPSLGQFDDVSLIVNQSESATRRGISQFFAQKKPDDLVLLYFSCHGVLDDRGRLYLAVKDTLHDLLKATGIAASFITDEMDSCRSRRQILIMDCCYGGAFVRGTKGGSEKALTQTTFEGAGYGRVVLTASDSTQFALEGDQVVEQASLSLFTHYLLNGMTTGEADQDEDGQITLDELYDYTYNQVVGSTPRQTPCKWSYNQQGDLVISKSPRQKVIKPAELSMELRDALQNPYSSVRLGAIEALKRLLLGSDPSYSLAAQIALESLTTDDSRSVSEAATKLLAELAAKQKKEEPLPPTPVREVDIPIAPVLAVEAEVISEPALAVEMASPVTTDSMPVQSMEDIQREIPAPLLEAEVVELPEFQAAGSESGVHLLNFWLVWVAAVLAGISILFFEANVFYSLNGNFFLVYFLNLGLVGAVTGTLQWLYLKGRVPWAGRWLAANILFLGIMGAALTGPSYDGNMVLVLSMLALWVGLNLSSGPFLALRHMRSKGLPGQPQEKADLADASVVIRGARFWLQWAGIAITGVVVFELAYEGVLRNVGEFEGFILPLLLISGAIIGLLQWSMIQPYRAGSWKWMLVNTAAIGFIGLFAAGEPMVLQIMVFSWLVLNLSIGPAWSLGTSLPVGGNDERSAAQSKVDGKFWLMWAGVLVAGVVVAYFTDKTLEILSLDKSPVNYFVYFLIVGGVIGIIQWWAMRGRLTAFWWWIPFNVVIVGWVGYAISPWHESTVIGSMMAVVYVLLNLASGPAMLLRKTES